MLTTDAALSQIAANVCGLLASPVTSVEELEQGRNSRVYRLMCTDGQHYLLKRYFWHGPGERDRLSAEFTGLQFLWEHGVRSIPRPLAADSQLACAVYEYLDGTSIAAADVTSADIEEAVEFLANLHALTRKAASRNLPLASEACFSVEEILETIQVRVDRLRALADRDAPSTALQEFLTQEFLPSLEEVKTWCTARLARASRSAVSRLEPEAWTLSPSDFGFHNALRRRGGHVAFLDFEHFGWDDPAKLVSDFLLHPQMDVAQALKRQFVAGVLRRFETRSEFAWRIETVYPLFGLKWCLILLNEFVPGDLKRRQFAASRELDREALQDVQLEKARGMRRRIMSHYEQFPYRG